MNRFTRYILNQPASLMLGAFTLVAVALLMHAGVVHAHAGTLGAVAIGIGSTLPSAGAVTLLDFAKSLDPDGKTAEVVELLSQTNEMLTDMVWIEGNLPTGHKTVIRTGLPTTVWRKLYQGVPPSKSTRAPVIDSCGMLETRSEIDVDAFLSGDLAAFRLSEAQAFLEAMNQNMQTAVIYETEATNPERITGFANRYNTLNAAENVSQNVIDGGGAGADNTSVYLVVWGKNTVHGIFPKSSSAGIKHDDLGIIDAFDANNDRYRAYADHWQWKAGLTVRDWRYVVRIANVDISDLVGGVNTQANTASTWIAKLMLRAMARIPAMGMGRPVFYANRTVKEMLSVSLLDKSNAALAIEAAGNQFGQVAPGSVGNGTLKFFGVPVRTVDAILSTESVVA